MAVSRITSAEEVNQWIDDGLTHKEISPLLQERITNERFICYECFADFVKHTELESNVN